MRQKPMKDVLLMPRLTQWRGPRFQTKSHWQVPERMHVSELTTPWRIPQMLTCTDPKQLLLINYVT